MDDRGDEMGVTLVGPAELPIVTDPTRLRVILRNLIANTRQHGAPPVTVTVDTAMVSTVEPTAADPDVGRTGVVITVHDAGDGVPANLADRVFDRFTRADTARHGASTGLGPAIARENARLLGGTLALAPDRTTFVPHLRDLAVTDRA